jgi:RHS repeat-associated protein
MSMKTSPDHYITTAALGAFCLPLVCLGHVRPAAWTGLSPSSFTPVNAANFDGGNRLLIQSSAYDAAGQQTAIGGYTFSYDAEGHVKSSTLAGATTTYTYDGDGRRITKTTGSSVTTYVYDTTGQLAAEYGGTAPATTTQYLTTDHLGSTRVVTSGSQAVVRRYDYFPFGEALRAGAGGRTDAGGYEPTEEPQKLSLRFTGKERDAETGLDYFGTRYMSAAQGRFTSPDTPLVYSRPDNPQIWNLYSYVGNNPLRTVDVDGHCGLDWNCWSEFGSGVADTTYRSIVQAVTSPVQTVKGAASAIAHPLDTAVAVKNAVVDTTKAALSGDPNAIGKVVGTVVSAVATAGAAKAASAVAETGSVARGLSRFGGSFLPAEATPGGGKLVLSTGTITQQEVATAVNGAMYEGGPINILTGAHGSPAGVMTADRAMFTADVQRFGGLPGVSVQDVTRMTPGQIKQPISGPGTTIGGFCNSAACLGRFK